MDLDLQVLEKLTISVSLLFEEEAGDNRLLLDLPLSVCPLNIVNLKANLR